MFSAEKLENDKIQFLVTERVQNSKYISILKTMDVDCIVIHPYFSRQLTLKGFTAKSIFFFRVLCGKA